MTCLGEPDVLRQRLFHTARYAKFAAPTLLADKVGPIGPLRLQSQQADTEIAVTLSL